MVGLGCTKDDRGFLFPIFLKHASPDPRYDGYESYREWFWGVEVCNLRLSPLPKDVAVVEVGFRGANAGFVSERLGNAKRE